MYEMTRDGYSMLVMGFTGKVAMEWKIKFLEAFNMMERIVKSAVAAGPNFDDLAFQLGYIQHLTAKVEESKAQSVQIEAQSEQIRDLAQTELQYERLQSTNHDRLYSLRETKNHLEVKEREFINWLIAAKYIYKPIKKDAKGRPVRKWGSGHKFETYYLPIAQYDSADGHKGYFVTIITLDDQDNDRPPIGI
jgi:phage regulator Rha-like protein